MSFQSSQSKHPQNFIPQNQSNQNSIQQSSVHSNYFLSDQKNENKKKSQFLPSYNNHSINSHIPNFANPFSSQESIVKKSSPKKNEKKKIVIADNIRQTSLFLSPQSLSDVAATSIKESQKLIKVRSLQYKKKTFKNWLRNTMLAELQQIQQIADHKTRKQKKKEFKELFQDNQEYLFQIYLEHIFQQDVDDDDDFDEYSEQQQIKEMQYKINGPLGSQFSFNFLQTNTNTQKDINSNENYNIQIRKRTVKKTGKNPQKTTQLQKNNKKNLQKKEENVIKQDLKLYDQTHQYQSWKKLVLQKQDQLLKQQKDQNRKRNEQAQKKIEEAQRRNKISHFQQILGKSNPEQNLREQSKNHKQSKSLAQKYSQRYNSKQSGKIQVEDKPKQIKNPFKNLIKQNQKTIENQINNRNKIFSQKLINKNEDFELKSNLNNANSLRIQNKKYQTPQFEKFLNQEQLKPYIFTNYAQENKNNQLQNKVQERRQQNKQISENKSLRFDNTQKISRIDITQNNQSKNEIIKSNQNNFTIPSKTAKENKNSIENSEKMSILIQDQKVILNQGKKQLIPAPNLPANVGSIQNNHIKNGSAQQKDIQKPESRTFFNLTDHLKQFQNKSNLNQNPNQQQNKFNSSSLKFEKPPNQTIFNPIKPIQQKSLNQIQFYKQNKINNNNNPASFNSSNSRSFQPTNFKQLNVKNNNAFISPNPNSIQFNKINPTYLKPGNTIESNLITYNNSSSNIAYNSSLSNLTTYNNSQLNQIAYNNAIINAVQLNNSNAPFLKNPTQNNQNKFMISKNQIEQNFSLNQKNNQIKSQNISNLNFISGGQTLNQVLEKQQCQYISDIADYQSQKSQQKQHQNQPKKLNIFKQNLKYNQIQTQNLYEKIVCPITFNAFVQSCYMQIKAIQKELQSQKEKCFNYQQRYKKTLAISQKVKQINMNCSTSLSLFKQLDQIQSLQIILESNVEQIIQENQIFQNQKEKHPTCQFIQTLKSLTKTFFEIVPQQQLQKSAGKNGFIQLYLNLSLIEEQIKISNQELEFIQIKLLEDRYR